MRLHHPHDITTTLSYVQQGWKAFPSHLEAIFLGVNLIQLIASTPMSSRASRR